MEQRGWYMEESQRERDTERKVKADYRELQRQRGKKGGNQSEQE